MVNCTPTVFGLCSDIAWTIAGAAVVNLGRGRLDCDRYQGYLRASAGLRRFDATTLSDGIPAVTYGDVDSRISPCNLLAHWL